MAGVYLAERLNTVLRMNWKSFSSQNYFDPNVLFMSVLWSGPLLVIAMIILASLNGFGAVASSVPSSSACFASSLKKVRQESPAAARFPPEASRLWRSMRTSRQIRTDGKGWPMISQMTSKISQEGRVFCSF
ncbi:uncharacterized protein LOC107458994 [Arachis duranensis]|uniref:Uncharacterized protein LOC107458994 n=1 Tax=Arachis duranensis TaxID=130453 RepID=A0A9C6T623_ARADU|nr:uncharacterized protein LOC107458994 [Arachis duranensis]